MALKITTIDTNGVKSRPLDRAEFGYDDYTDVGRVWIGTSAGTDLALAKLVEVEDVSVRVDTVESYIDSLNTINLFRADKYLAGQNVANMVYNANGKLSKVQYTNATDVNYEVLTYNANSKLENVAHYVGSVLKGNTVLVYSSGKLVSALFTSV